MFLVQKLNIYGNQVQAFGNKCTTEEAMENGFDPCGMESFVATVTVLGQTFISYGFDFADAVDTACKEIRYAITTGELIIN